MRGVSDNEAIVIPGIPAPRLEQLESLWAGQPRLQAVWLFGSRAMGRHGPGSDIEVGAFYWTVPAPDIVNSGREEQGSVSV